MKPTTLIAASLSTVMLGACDQPTYKLDQAQRQELFFKCMEKLPKGPDKVVYNDWDAVVSECGSQAYSMSQKCVKNCT